MHARANVPITTNGLGTDANVTITGAVNADDALNQDRTLTVDAGTGTVQFTSTVGTGGNGALADLDVTGGLIRLGGNVTANDGAGGRTVTFSGPVQLDANVVVTTDGTNDNSLQFAQYADGRADLGVTAGTGTWCSAGRSVRPHGWARSP